MNICVFSKEGGVLPFSLHPDERICMLLRSICAMLRRKKHKSLNNFGILISEFPKLIENKRKILWDGKTLLTVSRQYINEFVKKLIIYIIIVNVCACTQYREFRGLT